MQRPYREGGRLFLFQKPLDFCVTGCYFVNGNTKAR
nr:MAG TPA: hypothetical protein [Caudoviricetes sp.]